MNPQMLGITLSINAAVTGFQNAMSSMGKSISRSVDDCVNSLGALGNAWDHAMDESKIGSKIAVASAELASIVYAVSKVTEAYNDQYMALERLNSVAARFGDNQTAETALVNQFSQGALSAADAASTLANAANGLINPNTQRVLMSGFQNLLAFNRPRGMSFAGAMGTAMTAVARGDLGTLQQFDPYLQQELMIHGVNEQMLQDLRTQKQARLALYNILQQDFNRTRGDYDKWAASMPGALEIFRAHVINAGATIGKALLPSVLAIVQGLTKIVDNIKLFVETYPGIAKFAVAFAAIAAVMPVITAGFVAWTAFSKFIGPLSLVLNPLGEMLLVIAGAAALVAFVWKTNFLDLRTIFTDVWLMLQAAWQLIANMVGGSTHISGGLYNQLVQSGLLEYVDKMATAFFLIRHGIQDLVWLFQKIEPFLEKVGLLSKAAVLASPLAPVVGPLLAANGGNWFGKTPSENATVPDTKIHKDSLEAIGATVARAVNSRPLQVNTAVNLDGQRMQADSAFYQASDQLRADEAPLGYAH